MDLSNYRDYKSALKSRLTELRPLRPGLTLKRISQKIPIQYTYLSKVMNDVSTHLSEDDLFRFAQLLEFYPQEIDYLLCLRTSQTASLQARREHAMKKMSVLKKELRVRAKIDEGSETRLSREMEYLLDPFAVVVYVALSIPEIKNDPRLICGALGISLAKLKEILKSLSLLGIIEMGTGPLSIVEVKQNKIHYGKEHPLMRTHQAIFKTANLNQLLKLSEGDKESFQVTFTAESGVFEEIRGEFRKFLSRVQEIAERTKKNERVLQMNFDLFYWY